MGEWHEYSYFIVIGLDHSLPMWPAPVIVISLPLQLVQGVYVYDSEGKKYLDWTSEAVCVNLGHSVPESAAWRT